MNWRLLLRNAVLFASVALVLCIPSIGAGFYFLPKHPYTALVAASVIMSVLMLKVYRPCRRFFQPSIDQVLFSGDFSYLDALERLPNDLLEFTNLREMLEHVINRLLDVAKLERVRVFMHDPGHQSYAEMVFRGFSRGQAKSAERASQIPENGDLAQWLRQESNLWTMEELKRFPKFVAGSGLNELRDLGGAACFPINKENDLLGIVILGAKRSGEPFNPHDLKILRSLRSRIESFLTQAMVLTQEALLMVKDSHDMKNDVNALKGRISWRAMRLASWWMEFEREIIEVERLVAHESPKIAPEKLQLLLAALANLRKQSTEFYADANRGLPIEDHAITRLAHHLRNWAEFGRVVAQGFRGRRPQESIDVGQTARLSVDRWKPMAEKKNLQLTSVVSGSLFVWGERNLLEQIIENLIDNAVKATDRGFVRVICRQEESSIVVDVQDSGCGIAPDDLSGIFDKPFSHSRARKTVLDQSTGVGLYLVAQYARSLGGRVTVESSVGQGSTFRVILPASHKEIKTAESVGAS